MHQGMWRKSVANHWKEKERFFFFLGTEAMAVSKEMPGT